MDALPIALNRHQIELMYNQIGDTIAILQDQKNTFNSNSDQQQEQNLATYGTDNYEKAQALIQAVADELKSHLEGWNEASETSKPVPLSLNSYQLKLLRTNLETEQNKANDGGQAIKDILEQLPEFSPQEQAD